MAPEAVTAAEPETVSSKKDKPSDLKEKVASEAAVAAESETVASKPEKDQEKATATKKVVAPKTEKGKKEPSVDVKEKEEVAPVTTKKDIDKKDTTDTTTTETTVTTETTDTTKTDKTEKKAKTKPKAVVRAKSISKLVTYTILTKLTLNETHTCHIYV